MKPYYEDAASGITIYHGDCREIAADITFDVVVTDPPYGTGQKIAYDVYRDYMPNWRALMRWMLDLSCTIAFTMSHTRLFDLEKRPQWMGCWDKVFTGGVTSVGASPSWEPVCFYNMPVLKSGFKRWDDIFRYAVAGFPSFGHHDGSGHPCPKPVPLFQRLIGVMPAGIVLDPCMGSGATLRAAKNLARPAVGIEVSERYCEIAAKRLSQSVLPLEFVS